MRSNIGLIASIFIFSSTSFSAQEKPSFQNELKSMIQIVQNEFFKGAGFVAFDGEFTIVPELIIIEDSSKHPDGSLMPISETEMGVSVNSILLELNDRNATLFAIAHELGHGFSTKLLSEINCTGIGGPATEVIADLGAMWVLHLKGLSFEKIEQTVLNWNNSDIFDANASGDHPPGAERAAYVVDAIRQIEKGASFYDAVDNIIRIQMNTQCPSNN